MTRRLLGNYDIAIAVLVTALGVGASWHWVGPGWAAVVAASGVVTGLLAWGWERRYERRWNRFVKRVTDDDVLAEVLTAWEKEGRSRRDA
jgi:Flp pilus assembly protein TadB